MDFRKLMDLASGEVNFRILQLLHEKPMYSGSLSEKLSIDIRAIRVHLHHLRQHGFVDFNEVGRRHEYHIKSPFETPAHELIVSLVALAEPTRKRGEDQEPLPVEDLETQSRESYLSYLGELINGYINTFVRHSTVEYGKKLGEDLKEIQRRIEDVKND